MNELKRSLKLVEVIFDEAAILRSKSVAVTEDGEHLDYRSKNSSQMFEYQQVLAQHDWDLDRFFETAANPNRSQLDGEVIHDFKISENILELLKEKSIKKVEAFNKELG